MKTIFAAVAVSLMMSPAVAATAEDNCATVGGFATTAMSARQNGVPLSTVLEITSGSPLARTIVLEAYSGPKFNSEKNKTDSITEFGNMIMLTCLKEMT